MSRFKHVLMCTVMAAALLAVPAVPAFASGSPAPNATHTTTLAAGGTVTPDLAGCLSCW